MPRADELQSDASALPYPAHGVTDASMKGARLGKDLLLA
jgi:hypothetical protein